MKRTKKDSAGSDQKELPKDDALAVIRTETALSRFPVHTLAKGKIADIDIHDQAAVMRWKVSHNSDYGPAGPLAYKLDTLLVNRRIEESGRPVPRLIRLGTLPEIAEELGLVRGNWDLLRRALHQNASAYITTKMSYNIPGRRQKSLEAGFNRYNVIFTGETMPSGLNADAVYVVLSDIYQEVLNTAQWRPLDLGYMKSLTPTAQRFYEIVSYQIYAALHYGNARAKFTYSEYCLLSTATRYLDFDHVKKQMYKILRPHIQSGYLAKVEYESIVNERGEPDWIMCLTPGLNASREYNAFTEHGALPKTSKSKKARVAHGTEDEGHVPALPLAEDASLPNTDSGEASDDPETRELIELLIGADLNRSDAERFARAQPEVCRRQLKYLPFVSEFKISRGAYLRRAIEGDFGAPAQHERQQARERSKSASTVRKTQVQDEAHHEEARRGHQTALQGPFTVYTRECMDRAKSARPEAATAFSDLEAAQRASYTSGPLANRPLTLDALRAFDREENQLERERLFWCKQGVEVLSFWEWDQAINPKPFVPTAQPARREEDHED